MENYKWFCWKFCLFVHILLYFLYSYFEVLSSVSEIVLSLSLGTWGSPKQECQRDKVFFVIAMHKSQCLCALPLTVKWPCVKSDKFFVYVCVCVCYIWALLLVNIMVNIIYLFCRSLQATLTSATAQVALPCPSTRTFRRFSDTFSTSDEARGPERAWTTLLLYS